MLQAGAVTISYVTAAEVLLKRLQRVRPVDLAKALDVTPPLASMMLSGKRGIPTWHLDAIAVLLEVSVPLLFTDPDLVSQKADQGSVLHGRPDVADQARIQQQHAALLAATEAVAIQLADALAAQGITIELPHHDAGTATGQPRARKRPRKAS